MRPTLSLIRREFSAYFLSPIAYVVCAMAMALIVLCIADAGSRVSLTGGPYAYVGTAFGPYFGFISGVLLFMLGTFATAAVSTVFAASVGQLLPALSSGRRTIRSSTTVQTATRSRGSNPFR